MCEQCGCEHSKTQDPFEQKVKMIIESIRPNLQSHGGDVEFVATENGKTVKVRLQVRPPNETLICPQEVWHTSLMETIC